MSKIELKPCGNCNCSAQLVKTRGGYKYACGECWTETQQHGSIESAAKAWNKLSDYNAGKNRVHRYKYDVCGYTGEVILTGHHSHEDIVREIIRNLNYFEYEEVNDD